MAFFLAVLMLASFSGAGLGWSSARRSQLEHQNSQVGLDLSQQYDLGVQDLSAGRVEVAIQRFEYIIAQDPGYPGVTDKIAEAMQILYSTATPTAQPPTPTPTPTIDPRPAQELFQSALQLAAQQDWTAVIESLIALRKADISYMTARVDGLLFASLRNRGVTKILNEHNLQGGIYDLALAERFGPLDAQAINSRNLARLYLYGASFWEVDWAKAAEYFGQVASALPNLSDSSGWSAAERYQIALNNYGDQLASQGQWCEAQSQYQQAQAIRPDPAVEEKLQRASLMCEGPSPSPSITGDTPTPSDTPPGPEPTATPTATEPVLITPSATQSLNTPTATQGVPTLPPTQAPTDTLPAPTPYPAPAAQDQNDLAPGAAGLGGMLIALLGLVLAATGQKLLNW